jgi:acid phosphatase
VRRDLIGGRRDQADPPDVLAEPHGLHLPGLSLRDNAAGAPLHRRGLLTGLIGLASLAAAPAFAAGRVASPAGFVALGDWGQRGARVQSAVAAAMTRAAQAIASRFVISSGDNFYPAGVESVSDRHWKESFEAVYTDPALQTPWYAALGNHDYRGDPRAQVAYTRLSRRWRMPSRYYKVAGAQLGVADLDLFVIDTTPMVDAFNLDERAQQLRRGHWWSEDAQPQLVWLRDALAASRARWKIVVGHHPIYSGSKKHGDSPALIARVAPLLETYGVQAYINGHDHDLQHIRRGRVDYICTGAGSESGPVFAVAGTRYCLGRPGFAAFRLADEAMELQFHDLAGQTLYTATLSRSAGRV